MLAAAVALLAPLRNQQVCCCMGVWRKEFIKSGEGAGEYRGEAVGVPIHAMRVTVAAAPLR
ncbi:hypothetical protein LRH25_31395 [Ideonella azotifigens]|uniref:hypothetical protein n=1 Tax=Ideonella azotifigens TaxID=513160 RepID=UPI001E55D4B6|nr:hypothetical protein [Ideonella azotifigens]MCD2344830.1 hypothetical protein [Ideonella azotifigens]